MEDPVLSLEAAWLLEGHREPLSSCCQCHVCQELTCCLFCSQQQAFDSLGGAHLRFSLACSFLCANHVPPARGLCCHCWLLVPLAAAYCICFDLLGPAFSHPFSFYCGF